MVGSLGTVQNTTMVADVAAKATQDDGFDHTVLSLVAGRDAGCVRKNVFKGH